MKVLVLSTNTGGGHNAAGNAIIEALEEMGVRAELVDSLGVASKWGSKAVSDVYNGVAKHAPKLLGAGFGIADKMTVKKVRSASYALNLINVHRLEEFIFAKAPDAIVTTHVFCAQALTHLVKHAKIGAMTFGVTTDYNCGIYWEETKMDAYILPHPDLTAAYIAKGMDPQRLKDTYGEKLIFWGGGTDTQSLDPHPDLDEVRANAQNLLEIFSKNGNYVFTQIHNFQADTEPETILAIFDTAKSYREKLESEQE